MDVALWIATGALALVFLPAGLLKLTQSPGSLVEKGQAWAGDTPALVKPVGLLEVLGVLGLVLPELLGVAEVLTPLAAVGLALMMLGAMVVHGRRQEWPNIGVNVVIAAVAVFVAVGRF